MILGIGHDLCDIRRIEKTLATFGSRFAERCFTTIEQGKSDRRAGRGASYAKRFAAKEACAKALGTGLRHGVFWRDMGVVNLPSGQPTLTLTGGGGGAPRRTDAARSRRAHPSHHHGRVPTGLGPRHHRGRPGSRALRRRPPKCRCTWRLAALSLYACGQHRLPGPFRSPSSMEQD